MNESSRAKALALLRRFSKNSAGPAPSSEEGNAFEKIFSISNPNKTSSLLTKHSLSVSQATSVESADSIAVVADEVVYEESLSTTNNTTVVVEINLATFDFDDFDESDDHESVSVDHGFPFNANAEEAAIMPTPITEDPIVKNSKCCTEYIITSPPTVFTAQDDITDGSGIDIVENEDPPPGHVVHEPKNTTMGSIDDNAQVTQCKLPKEEDIANANKINEENFSRENMSGSDSVGRSFKPLGGFNTDDEKPSPIQQESMQITEDELNDVIVKEELLHLPDEQLQCLYEIYCFPEFTEIEKEIVKINLSGANILTFAKSFK